MRKVNTIAIDMRIVFMMILFFAVTIMFPSMSVAEVNCTEWYGDGSGSEFSIKTADELACLAILVNDALTISFQNKTIILEADIDLSDHYNENGNWSPIGIYNARVSDNKPFKGTLDGNGHAIKNLTINTTTNYQGLFGNIGTGGNIKNLALENVNITGGQFAGGIAGTLDGGTIENVYVSGNVSGTADYIGGIAGDIIRSAVRNCYSTADVTSTGYNVGGIVGIGEANSIVENCYATGNIKGLNYIGGVSGSSNSAATIRNSAALNNYISSATGTGYGRIHGASTRITPTLLNNFAWEGLLVNDEKKPGIFNDRNGEDKSADEIINNLETWSAFSEDYWLVSAGSPPILKVFLGNENIEQIALYPEYLFGEPDEILPEQEWYYNRSAEDKVANIYRIGKAEELAYLAHIVHTQNSFSGKTILLTRDIDFTDFDWSKEASELNKYEIHVNATTPPYPYDGNGWIPIGRAYRQFQGTFDGNGYVIKNLYIDRPNSDHQGFLGYASYVSSSIKNLGIVDANVIGGDLTGIMTGTANLVENSFTTGSVEGMGGIAGMGRNISNSYSTADVTRRGSGGEGCNGTGGVYGCNNATTDFTNLYATGTVIGGSGIGNFFWSPVTGRGLVALNNSVTGSRIGNAADRFYEGKMFEHNYTWENMLVDGEKITNADHWFAPTSAGSPVHGADVTADEIYYGTVWSADYANYPTDIWIIEEGKLPILRIFEMRNNERGGVSVQPSAIPQYILDDVNTVSDLYSVEVGDSDNGEVTANLAKAKAGDTVTLTITPDSGYRLASLYADIDGSTEDWAGRVDEATGTVTFIMPGHDVAVA